MKKNDTLLSLLQMLYGDANMNEGLSFVQMDQLEELLIQEKIPYERFKRFNGEQICYYGINGKQAESNENVLFSGPGVGAVCSVILTTGSYGHEKGLLEISGLMTEEEYDETGDSVLGYLDAVNVFERIKKHFNENK